MGFTVSHEGGTKDSEHQTYLLLLNRQLVKRGARLDSVPRVKDKHNGRAWLYVWEREEDASAFAAELKKQTRDPDWLVRPVKARPSLGPLGPLEIRVGRQGDGWTFGLAPFSRIAIQMKYPDACQYRSVFIGTNTRDEPFVTGNELHSLAGLVLLLLTRLSFQQLHSFETVRIVDSADHKELMPPSTINGLSAVSEASGTNHPAAPGG